MYGCQDYAGIDEINAIRIFERHLVSTETCWCKPLIYRSVREINIIHQSIVPLNAS
jgi:hypothetical protein